MSDSEKRVMGLCQEILKEINQAKEGTNPEMCYKLKEMVDKIFFVEKVTPMGLISAAMQSSFTLDKTKVHLNTPQGQQSPSTSRSVVKEVENPKKGLDYTESDLDTAIDEVQNGRRALHVARKYGIPPRVLIEKVKILEANTVYNKYRRLDDSKMGHGQGQDDSEHVCCVHDFVPDHSHQTEHEGPMTEME